MKDLVNRTLELLKDRPRSLTFAEIEKKTGIKDSWLRKFSIGKIENPSARKIQALYDLLSEKPLKVN